MTQANDGGTAATGRAVARSEKSLDPRTERDHEAISKLADDLLPALIAKLAASGLGEIEVREGEWKARLRKPAGTDRAVRGASDGHSHGYVAGRGATAGQGSGAVTAERDRLTREEEEVEAASLPILATSPAVGVYQPRKDLAAGMRVRAGDRLGTVDVLGVREDVVAPIDGVIGSSLAEAGEAVEYGQELVRIELPDNARGLDASGSDREAVAVLGEA